MGFHCSAVFNAQLSHVTDKCNIIVKGPYQLSSSVVLPHGFPLFCRLQRAVVPCHRQVQHHHEGSVPTLKLSCTTPWVSTILPSSTRSGPMSPTSVTSCPRWILSNTVSHHVPFGSCPTPCHIMSPLDPVQHRWMNHADG